MRAHRLLLVTDSPTARTAVEEALNAEAIHRYEITAAPRLSAALPRLGVGQVDVVVLDLELPDSRGEATFDAVKATGTEAALVVLRGAEDPPLAMRLIAAGADDVLTAGASGDAVACAVRHAVARAALRRRLAERERGQAAEKAAALGALVANVAHEIGNPAHSIMLGTSLIGDAWDELAPLVDRELAARPGETAATEAREELAAVLADLRIAAERIKSAVARLRQHVREEQLPAPPAGPRRR